MDVEAAFTTHNWHPHRSRKHLLMRTAKEHRNSCSSRGRSFSETSTTSKTAGTSTQAMEKAKYPNFQMITRKATETLRKMPKSNSRVLGNRAAGRYTDVRATDLKDTRPTFQTKVGEGLTILERWAIALITRDADKAAEIFQQTMCLWYMEMLLSALSVPTMAIRSTTSDARKAQVARTFADPSAHACCLLTNYACGAFGLNLHGGCARVVLIESPPNQSAVWQAGGRVHRLGQQEPQKVWFLFQDRTISRWLEWNNTKKEIPQLAGQLHNVLKDLVQAAGNAAVQKDLGGRGG